MPLVRLRLTRGARKRGIERKGKKKEKRKKEEEEEEKNVHMCAHTYTHTHTHTNSFSEVRASVIIPVHTTMIMRSVDPSVKRAKDKKGWR